MAEIKIVSVSNLFLDTANPRLEERERSQREAIREMADLQKQKLLHLASDILEHGLNPSELLMIVPDEKENDKYVVLEGNRRLVALKILENPDTVNGIYSQKTFQQLKIYSQAYRSHPVQGVPCVELNKSEALHWIEQRHLGEQDGVGIVKWGGEETARFRRRYGESEVALQILDFLESEGILTPQERQGLTVTNLKRVVEGREAREKIGYKIENGIFVPSEDRMQIAKLLKRIVVDFSSGKKKVSDVYHKADRIRYLDEIIANELEDGTTTSERSGKGANQPAEGHAETQNQPQQTGSGAATTAGIASSTSDQNQQSSPNNNGGAGTPSTGSSQENATTAQRKSKSDKSRNVLIPKGFSLNIQQNRIKEIFDELTRLSLKDYPNAVAVLFRVFLELGIDDYIYRYQNDFLPKSPADSNYKLNVKMVDVVTHLEKAKLINQQQAKAFRHAANLDQFKVSMIDLLNQFVHNLYIKPSPDELKTRWDNLEKLFQVIWP